MRIPSEWVVVINLQVVSPILLGFGLVQVLMIGPIIYDNQTQQTQEQEQEQQRQQQQQQQQQQLLLLLLLLRGETIHTVPPWMIQFGVSCALPFA